MAIDRHKVKAFWDERAKKLNSVSFESIANLEEDPKNLELKIQLETAKVFAYLGSVNGKSIVDLGAGVGQWTFRFAEGGASLITAVEYSADLARIGRQEAARRGLSNVEFVVSPAEEFAPQRKYDIVYISGLFVYMNDDQADKFVKLLPSLCTPGAMVLLRDGTSILGRRYEINDRKSEHLQTMYSATYRTREQYLELFEREGFRLVKDENMFDEGCPLNKYPETRLRIYSFRPPGA